MKTRKAPLHFILLLLKLAVIFNGAHSQQASLFEIGQRMEDTNFPGLLNSCKYNSALGDTCKASQQTAGNICTPECTNMVNSYTPECQNALGLSWLSDEECVRGSILATPIILPTEVLPTENTMTVQNLTLTWNMLLNTMMEALYYNESCDPVPTTNALLMQRCRTEIPRATECPQSCIHSVEGLSKDCFRSVAEAATANLTVAFADIVISGQQNPCPEMLKGAALVSLPSARVVAAVAVAVFSWML